MAKNTTKTNVKSEPVTNAAPDIQAKLADTVKATTEMLEGVKEVFKVVNDRDIKLSDKVLSEVIGRAKDWDTWDDDQKMAFLLKAEETAATVMIADPGITKLVAKIDGTFKQVVDTCLEAKVTDKASAVMVLAQFRRVFTHSEMASMPMPGWDEEDAKGTSYKPDKRKVKASTGEPITVTWTNDFVSAMPEGKGFEDDLAVAKKESDNPGSTRFKALDKDGLKAVIASATQGRNNLRSLVKRAIKLHHRWEAARKLNQIGIRWITGTKTKGVAMPEKFGQAEPAVMVSLSPKPIWIYDASDPSKGRDFSVTQLLAMQPELAKLGEGGGTMADLIATAGKGADDQATDDGLKAGEAMADDEAQATGSMLVNFFTKTENRAHVLKSIADYKKDPAGQEWLGILMELDRIVHPIAEKNRNTYENIQKAKMLNADNEAEETADAA